MTSGEQLTSIQRFCALVLGAVFLSLVGCAPNPDPWIAVGLTDTGIRVAGGVASLEEATSANEQTQSAGRVLSGQVTSWEEAAKVEDFLSLIQSDPIPELPSDGAPPRLYLMRGTKGWAEMAVPTREAFVKSLPAGAVVPEEFDAYFRAFAAWEEEQKLPQPIIALVITESGLDVYGHLRRGKVRDRILGELTSQFPDRRLENRIEVSDAVRRFPLDTKLPAPPALPEKDPKAIVATYTLGGHWKVIASGREAEGSTKRLVAEVGDRLDVASILIPYHDEVANWEAEQRKPWPWLALAAYGKGATLFGEVRSESTKKEVLVRAKEILDGFDWEAKLEVTDTVRYCKDSGASLRTFPRPPRDGRPGALAATWLGETWKRGDPRLPNSLQGQFPRDFGWDDLIAEFGRLSRPIKTEALSAEGVREALPVDVGLLIDPWVAFLINDQQLHISGEVYDQRAQLRLQEKLSLNFPQHEIVGAIQISPFARPVEDFTLTIGTTPRADGGWVCGTARLGYSWQDDGVYVVYFDENEEAAGSELERLKKQLLSAIETYPQATFEFVGHTDAQGDAITNLQLSAQRAGGIVDKLLDEGLPIKRLRSRGMGETVPDGDNSTEEGRRQNRRVQIRLLLHAGEGTVL